MWSWEDLVRVSIPTSPSPIYPASSDSALGYWTTFHYDASHCGIPQLARHHRGGPRGPPGPPCPHAQPSLAPCSPARSEHDRILGEPLGSGDIRFLRRGVRGYDDHGGIFGCVVCKSAEGRIRRRLRGQNVGDDCHGRRC